MAISGRSNGFLRQQRLASQREDGELFLLELVDVCGLASVRHCIRASLRLRVAAPSSPAAAAGVSVNRHACARRST